MEVTNTVQLTPKGVLAVVLRGDFELAQACSDALRDYAYDLPCDSSQVPAIIYHEGEWRFDVVNPWNNDGSVM